MPCIFEIFNGALLILYTSLQTAKHVLIEEYIVRKLFYPTNSRLLHTMKCACCGADMLPDKELENTIIYKCKECGLTDSRLKDIG
jgi:hypothetical protein